MRLRGQALLYFSCAVLLGGCSPDHENTPAHEESATLDESIKGKLASTHLTNPYRLTRKVISGGTPQGLAAFQELNRLGVETVISVDGAAPDVALAKHAGLRYIHLPFGYDGVPPERALELAKALKELDGGVYVHCHHGTHRGPAAAAVGCIMNGTLSTTEALADLQAIGTGQNYQGLWASVREARPAAPADLKMLKVKFQASVPVPQLAEAMAKLDEHLDALKASQQTGWKPGTPGADPAHTALLARELLTEIMRTGAFAKRPGDFKQWMQAAEQCAEQLELDLAAAKQQRYANAPTDKLAASMQALQENCATCHKHYRNTPRP